ncbi:MAG: DNA mismatch repair protein MutS [Anaerolineaceae bacterium]
MSEDITPIRQQYLDIKRQYPDTIVFFRLGDFYETFDHDAEITSRELDIVLTSRGVSKGTRIPMAGIPYHAVDNYLSRLIEGGYHVAICEQIGEQPQKGIFPRQVVRVVTPGTVVEPSLLPGSRNNYLAAIVAQENSAAIAYVDITTGEFAAAALEGADLQTQLRAEVERLRPAEILLPDNLTFDWLTGSVTMWPAWHFETGRCRETLLSHFEVLTLDGFGFSDKPLAIRAAGAILQYLKDTQPSSLQLLKGIATYSLDEFMVLDASTRRNLELTETIRTGDKRGSLLSIIDQTITAMGQRMMVQWINKPLLDIEVIHNRQERISTLLKDGLLRAEIRGGLKPIADLERLANRIQSGHAVPRELTALRESLRHIPNLYALFPEEDEFQPFKPPAEVLCQDILELLEAAIDDEPPATLQNTGVIRPGYSNELDGVIEASKHARDWISSLENVERERLGIKTLKVGYNKVFGYYIEITHSNTINVPPEYIRKQTLVNAERYITPEMKEYETLVLNAESRIHEIELRLFREVCAQISLKADKLLRLARSLAGLDVYASLAETASLGSYTRPEITHDRVLRIIDGRHPVVEQSMTSERFVVNDAVFADDEMIRVITGPNMSGKSTFLRQVALIVLLAQMGSYVPAREARIGLVDRIFTRIGAQDEIHAGQSTFMVEMVETANILNHATNRSLLVLDEIGRGTSTYDGLSIAWAVIEFIHNHPRLRARTLFATHFHELTQLSDLLPGVMNYNVAVSESGGQVVFLHKIVPGGADRSYGIHVAQLAGLPQTVIQRASEILKELESSSGTAMKIEAASPMQMVLFPETNPILEDLKDLDINALSPIEALNKLYEWQKTFVKKEP